MTDSLRLSVPDLGDPAQRDAFYGVAAAAVDVDGYDPFSEQARLDLESGRRSPILVTTTRPVDGEPVSRDVGAAILGRGELDFVIDPLFRGMGYGGVALRGLLATVRGTLTAWSRGDHPAARRLAEQHCFFAERTVLHLGVALADALSPVELPPGLRLTPMLVGVDDEEWVELNARIFDTHPEQGRLTVGDLAARVAEPWFDAGDAQLLRDASDRLVGYVWVRVGAGDGDRDAGELYVLGVDPGLAGRGIGRSLLRSGMARLSERGCTEATVSVEADDIAAVQLFRSAGFAERAVDVQYRRSL